MDESNGIAVQDSDRKDAARLCCCLGNWHYNSRAVPPLQREGGKRSHFRYASLASGGKAYYFAPAETRTGLAWALRWPHDEPQPASANCSWKEVMKAAGSGRQECS